MKLALHLLLSLGLAGITTSVVLLRKTSPSATPSFPPETALISTISSLRTSLRTLLAPPYIYLLLNFIIISIAASSSLLHRYFPHNHHNDDYINHNNEFDVPDPPVDSDASSSVSGESDSSILVQFDNKLAGNFDDTWSAIADENRKESRPRLISVKFDDKLAGNFDDTCSAIADERRSDGSKLGQLVEEDEGDTLEALWKSIAEENKRKHSENQPPALLSKADLTKLDDLTEAWDAMKAEGGERRRLRKSESTRPRGGVRKGEVKKEKVEEEKELRKSETFNDAVSARRRGGLLRRDPSLSVDELNGRVEAFINNFNHQMRLQRQESEQRFLDMMKRGV